MRILGIPRATITETYAQILADFKAAAEILPNKPANNEPIEQYGHANRWAAQAYIGRAFLYYIGYMTNIEKEPTTEISLPNNEGVMNKTSVVAFLDDCIEKSGYKLLDDFRNLWPYSYVNKSASISDPAGTHPVLPWAETEGLEWAGQDGFHSTNGTGNTEVMFALRYSFGNWGWSKQQAYNNEVCLYTAIRDQGDQQPFGQGWGWCTIHPTLFSQWDDADLRKKGSILEAGDTEQGMGGVTATGDHHTGLYNKKYISLQHNGDEGVVGMFNYIYNYSDIDMQVRHAQDFYYMRFADVLLMHSELSETATGLNKVRKRAGYTDDIAYSLDAIKKERKHEFAFEGIRWFDLVRWGDVENTSMNFYDNAIDVTMDNGSVEQYSVSYPVVTKGLVSIPESEIRLSNGVYVQNPGWED